MADGRIIRKSTRIKGVNMKITLPKDVVKMAPQRSPKKIDAFRFSRQAKRMIVPIEVREIFPGMGVDMYVSKSENSLYMTFGPKGKTQFLVSSKNGYVGCACLFTWFTNAGVSVLDRELYPIYDIDRKNKIVKLKLVRI